MCKGSVIGAVLATAFLMGTSFGVLAAKLDLETVNNAGFEAISGKKGAPSAAMIKAQVMLDRAGVSPGVIDGHGGGNTDLALAAFKRINGLQEGGKLDRETWDKLAALSPEPVLREYEITRDDVNGPFTEEIPAELEKKAELKRLAYSGPKELLAERFHMDEDLLEALNPKAAFDKAGAKIVVAAIDRGRKRAKVARVEVDKSDRALRAFDKGGNLVATYPATIGSEDKPAPSGVFEVKSVTKNPTWWYNPEFAFKGVKADKVVKVAPGPNNPVGSVWIDLSAETYGIHGTPEPSKVGKTFSHGCVRLTNWDAEELAGLVGKGTKVEFLD